ncbi:HigA family addiction module antitoxin [Rhodovulum sp. PH10]|uniref:HigA family addiction module antitoxin n=1 Tax=Rhodovulum sp. PH10 TaxID=1187851 RepID=UPI00192CDAF7|nr:HigA family addiction module antitoxin [Rhodovulum sp. PH10]
MAIERDELDRRRVDFSDVQSGRRLPPVHPGEILRDEFLVPMSISVYALANAIKAPRSRVNDIVLGRRAISTDTELRLSRYFGTSAEFWVKLQTRYDLEIADRTMRASHRARGRAACGPNSRGIRACSQETAPHGGLIRQLLKALQGAALRAVGNASTAAWRPIVPISEKAALMRRQPCESRTAGCRAPAPCRPNCR